MNHISDKTKHDRGKKFFERAKEIHGDTYDYSKVEYKGARKKIEIICKTHGSFFQTAGNHLNRPAGCPQCGLISMSKSVRSGCSDKTKNDICSLYIIRLTGNNEEFYKIGITNNIPRRFKEIRCDSRYNIELMFSIIDTRHICSKLEHKLLIKYNKQNKKYIPNTYFLGQNECFTYL